MIALTFVFRFWFAELHHCNIKVRSEYQGHCVMFKVIGTIKLKFSEKKQG